jgi:hypothetical protein
MLSRQSIILLCKDVKYVPDEYNSARHFHARFEHIAAMESTERLEQQSSLWMPTGFFLEFILLPFRIAIRLRL